MTAIIGVRTNTDRDWAAANLAFYSPHRRFLDEMFEPLWSTAVTYGIDPIVMVAQSLKETGAGKYTGNVPPTYFNTAGIKVRDLTPFGANSEVPLAHSQYASFYGGAEAQAQHLYAYMNRYLPTGRYLVDPRWVWVKGKHNVTQVEELGTRWAPNPNYGVEIVGIMNTLTMKGTA